MDLISSDNTNDIADHKLTYSIDTGTIDISQPRQVPIDLYADPALTEHFSKYAFVRAEDNTMNNNSTNLVFGKINNSLCRLSIDGKTAINTGHGYKTYDVETGTCTNCDNFVLGGDLGLFFYVIPTNSVKKGDIILASGKPHCVIEVKDDGIKAFCYENSTIVTIIPERHLFLGENYLYSKIVSLFGHSKNKKSIMKFMLISQLFGGGTLNSNLAMMMFMMNENGTSIFDEMLDLNMDEKE